MPTTHKKGRPRVLQRAVVLFSGGLDSSVTLALAAARGRECHALTFAYGQRHGAEIRQAKKTARILGARSHRVVRVPFPAKGSALTSAARAVPKDRPLSRMAREIPATYVPARNTVFLALALSHAETLGAGEIFIGANALDYSGYPDCRPEFLRQFEKLARLGTKTGAQGRGIKIRAPLVRLTKAQIIGKGTRLGVDFSKTHSCYDPGARGRPCGRCDSCRLRLKGFAKAGLEDPLPYLRTGRR